MSVASGGAKTITYWGEFCGDDVKRLPALLTPFEQAHPGTKVEVIPVCESGVSELEKLTALFAGGSPPDLLFWTGTIASIARTNLAADLGPLVTRDKVDLTQFNPALLDFYARWEGKLYGLPIGYGGNGLAVVYNRTLFKNASIAEPPTKWGDATWTWDSMVAIGQKLTKVTGNTFQQVGWSGLGYYMDVPQLWQTSWITTDLKTIVCDTAAMVDCYTHYGDLTTKYHVTAKPGEQTPKGGFLSGTVGMGTIGGWQFTDYAKATNLDWAFAPYPKVVASGGQTSPVLLELANGAKHQEDGWTLMQYLLQDSRQGIWQNYVPVQPDVRTKWGAQLFAGRDVRVQVLMGAIEAALPDDRILLTKSWPQMSKPVGDAMTNLRAGKETAENTLRALKPQLQGILDQNG